MKSQVSGRRTSVVDYTLRALLALVIVIGIQPAGVILVMPAATADLLVGRYMSGMPTAAALGRHSHDLPARAPVA